MDGKICAFSQSFNSSRLVKNTQYFTDRKLADIHFVYGLAEDNAQAVQDSLKNVLEYWMFMNVNLCEERKDPYDVHRKVSYAPCSPDLNRVDFFLWGALKTVVCATPVESEMDRVARIVCPTTYIQGNLGVFDQVHRFMVCHSYSCIACDDEYLDHLLGHFHMVSSPTPIPSIPQPAKDAVLHLNGFVAHSLCN
ncbi:hypothetical protein CEXT_481651 [Caerostris extrusa]|uniref:C2H2-type domain-containing protein n=1 Tax=Caerostris extrusa TaxID=172846 RepID=A0AAV4VK47_CAEEX|nr:hypothetical protein CEXT_481651 [Caerostris extrusa]